MEMMDMLNCKTPPCKFHNVPLVSFERELASVSLRNGMITVLNCWIILYDFPRVLVHVW